MKIIRIWGIAAFFVLLALLAAIWILVAPSVIKSAVEETGSEALGAKVEVKDVDLSLIPLTVTIKGLTAADPDHPMKNIADVKKVSFGVDTSALMWRKIVIDELTIDGIKTGTAREISGALPGGRKTSQAISQVTDVSIPEISQADIEKMVDEADLITKKRIAEFNQQQQSVKAYWNKALDKKAFNERTAKIKAEYKRLADRAKKNKFNLIKDAKDWKQLKKDISKERDNLKAMKNKLSQDKKALAASLKKVKAGPKDDVNAILARVGLDDGVKSLSDKYLGPQYTPWVEKALAMIKDVKPGDKTASEEEEVYSRSKGKRIRFKDEQLFPDVLIKKVVLNGEDQNWKLGGDGTNLGYFPWLVGEPAKLDLKFSDGKQGNASLKVNSAWPNENKMNTTINGQVSNWSIKDMQLMNTGTAADSGKGSWQINSGQLAASVNGNITLQDLNLKVSLKLSSPKIKAPDNLTGWQKTMAGSLNAQKAITIDLQASGPLDKPDIKVSSSLERLFKSAIGQKVKQQAEKLRGKVAEKIQSKVGDLSKLDGLTKDFDQWSKGINLNDGALKDLLGKVKI